MPGPVGSQAPQAPTGDIKGSEHRPPSRREAIQAAFERASNPTQPARHAPKPAPKPAEAKAGHNQPPEETEKFDLKKRPAAAAPHADQPREQGRFASRTPGQPQNRQAPQAGQQPGQQQPGQQQPRRLPENTPFRDPPARISEHAKAAWANTPEAVRGEVHRQQQEFLKAYNFYKAGHEAMQPIMRFHQMAQEHGTTLETALTNYTGMEQKLRADPIAGLDLIVHNLNLRTSDNHRLTLRDIAYHVLSQSPDQLKAIQQGNNMQAAAHQIGALHQQVAGLQNHLQQMHTQQEFRYTRSAVDQFASSHPRFDELGPLIEQELRFGYDLETAYRRAALLRPSTQAAQTRTTSAQTRPADRSIRGSPDTVANGGRRERPKDTSRSPREAIEKAIGRMNGAY
jgi:hypothetical protein